MSTDKIFGYTWEAIQRAQQGGRLQSKLSSDRVRDPSADLVTDQDRELLAEHGSIEALKDAGFHGTVDRLQRAAPNSSGQA